jgi:hypothetical protein
VKSQNCIHEEVEQSARLGVPAALQMKVHIPRKIVSGGHYSIC